MTKFLDFAQSKNLVIPSDIHHRQNPLESTNIVFCFIRQQNIQYKFSPFGIMFVLIY
jgi:hypothetical protein